MILLHGLKEKAIVVQVSLLHSILHAVIGISTPRPVSMRSLHIM
jgi:hypothetical protein